MADALRTLVRLRQGAVSEAKRLLASCLDAETRARNAAAHAERRITLEAEAACRIEAGDAAVESFAAWLPAGRQAVEEARRAEQAGRAETERARAAMVLARTAAEAAEKLLAKREAELAAEAQRKAQLALDELARGRPRK